jgi:flagellar basal body-associated protein FliL
MAKEAQEVENNEEQENEAPVLPMFSKQGKIVYIVSLVILVVGFAAFVQFSKMPEQIPDELKKKKSPRSVQDLNAPRVDIAQPIIISIPTNELATEFRHLAVKLTLIIGRLPDEFTPGFNLMNELTKEQFIETAEKFTPFVEDRVNKIALSFTYLELQSESARKEFTNQLKTELNQILGDYGLKPRINEVLIKSFIFTD